MRECDEVACLIVLRGEAADTQFLLFVLSCWPLLLCLYSYLFCGNNVVLIYI